MSRFACYVVKQTQDFDDRVWLDAEEDAVPQEVTLYEQLASCGLYQARCCEASSSPWSECEDDGEVD